MLNTTEIFLGGTSEHIFPFTRTYRQTVPVRDMLPYRWLAKTTGSELSDCRAFLFILVCDVASDNVMTSYQTVHVSGDQVRKNVEASVELNALPDEAKRLREISGLTVEQLAELFHISRPTFHEWLRGSSLTNKHREHLLEILPLIEEASQRFGSPNATSTWLLTPVSPAGKKPIDYLSERQYAVFRGFLLRQSAGQQLFRPLTPSKRVYLERSREEVEDVRERLRPRMHHDEIDVDAVDLVETGE